MNIISKANTESSEIRPRRRGRTKEQVDAFCDALEAGQPIYTAMIRAGFSPHVAARGRAGVPKRLRRYLPATVSQAIGDQLREYVEAGQRLTAAERADYVRGRALAMATAGTDRGAQALKLIGQDRAVNLFVPDTQVGVIVLGESKKLEELEAGESGLVLTAGDQKQLQGQDQLQTQPPPPRAHTGRDL